MESGLDALVLNLVPRLSVELGACVSEPHSSELNKSCLSVCLSVCMYVSLSLIDCMHNPLIKGFGFAELIGQRAEIEAKQVKQPVQTTQRNTQSNILG